MSFFLLSCMLPISFKIQERIQLRTLSAGMGKSNNMDKRCGHKFPVKGRSNPKSRGVAISKRAVQTIDVPSKTHNCAKGIVHNGATKNHTAVIDTGFQQFLLFFLLCCFYDGYCLTKNDTPKFLSQNKNKISMKFVQTCTVLKYT